MNAVEVAMFSDQVPNLGMLYEGTEGVSQRR